MKLINLKKATLGENGFTLLEVLIAISILTFGLLALAKMQISAIQGAAAAFDLTESTNCATIKIEDLINKSYNDSDLVDQDDPKDGTAGLTAVGADADFSATCSNEKETANYTLYWNVAEDSPLTGSKTVNVIVQWESKMGDAILDKSASFRFIKSDL